MADLGSVSGDKTSSCPTGHTPVGGGFQVSDPNMLVVVASMPDPIAEGWTVRVDDTPEFVPGVVLTVYARCIG